MGSEGTLEVVARELGRAFATLQDLAESPAFAELLGELGIDQPPELSSDSSFMGKLDAAARSAAALEPLLDHLILAIEAGKVNQAVAAGLQVLGGCAAFVKALDVVGDDLPRATMGLPNASDLAALAPTFTGRVIEDVLATYLDLAHPLGERLLRLLGVIERTVIIGEDQAVIARRRLFFERVPQLLSDPLGVLRLAYHWGEPSFDARLLLRNLAELLETVGPLTGGLGNDDSQLTGGQDDIPDLPPSLELFSLNLGKSTDSTPGLQAELFVDVGDDQQVQLAQISDSWRFVLELGGSYRIGWIAKLLPPVAVSIKPPTGSFAGHLGIQFVGQAPAANEWVELFSIAAGSKIDAKIVRRAA
jgi:hypothetical protein